MGKAVSGLEDVLIPDGACKLFVADAHAGGHARADDDLGIDHSIEHLAAQPIVCDRVDEPGTEGRLELLAAARVTALEVVVADLPVVDGGDRDGDVRSHVLVDAPEREGNADEDDDPPCDPTGRVVSNELEHVISLGGSHIFDSTLGSTPEFHTLSIRWEPARQPVTPGHG